VLTKHSAEGRELYDALKNKKVDCQALSTRCTVHIHVDHYLAPVPQLCCSMAHVRRAQIRPKVLSWRQE
jgi:hypothetical protein